MKLAIKERLAASGAASKLLSKLPGRGDIKPGKKRRWKKFAVAGVALVVAAGVGWQMLSPGQSSAASATSYTTAEVTRMDVSSSITGSGTLEAADSYSVTTLIEGSILTADFEEGDEVEEGTILYTIDSSDASNSLEQAEISLNQAQRSYNNQLESQEDLTITAPVAGQVYSIDVEVGGRCDRRGDGGHHPGLPDHESGGLLPRRRRILLLCGAERHGHTGLHL